MKRTWIYFSNQFDNATRRSTGKMLKIGNDHDSRLSPERKDPDIDALWVFFNPLLLLFRKLFSAWQAAVATKLSRTLSLTKMLKLMSDTWVKAWEGKVFFYFPEGTPEALSIFPNTRRPFQEGGYEERILAVNTLAESMSAYEELTDVAKDVADKYKLLLDARDAQKQAMQLADNASDALEKQRKILADALYKNMGTLLVKYFDNPTEAQRFFNESLIRKPGSDTDAVFNHSAQVNAGLTQVIALPKKFKMSINALLSIQNSNGGSTLEFFFADSASASDSPLKATAMPGEALEITTGEIGWSSINTTFIVKNTGTLTAEFELILTEAAE